MSDSMVADLKAVPLFQAVSDHDLAALAARTRLQAYPKDHIVFKEGAAADSLCVVMRGSVKIFINDASGAEVVLDTKTAGQYFGEMMLDHRPRSASVVTLEPCEVAVVSRSAFQGFLRAHPAAAEQVILNLIRVARDMNERTRGYVAGLQSTKARDLPAFKRWRFAKRWVLGGLLVLAITQFYLLEVLLQIMSLGGVTVFVPR